MKPVNMLQAKSTLSRLVQAIENGEESEIVIARNGRPAAKLVPIASPRSGPRIGIAKGKFDIADDFDRLDVEIAQLFTGRLLP